MLSFLTLDSREVENTGEKKRGCDEDHPSCATFEKEKKYDFFEFRFVARQISRVGNAYVTTINRRSIRADSPLITNKYLTSSSQPPFAHSRPDFAFNELVCVSSLDACVSNVVERERERGFYLYSFEFVRRRG